MCNYKTRNCVLTDTEKLVNNLILAKKKHQINYRHHISYTKILHQNYTTYLSKNIFQDLRAIQEKPMGNITQHLKNFLTSLIEKREVRKEWYITEVKQQKLESKFWVNIGAHHDVGKVKTITHISYDQPTPIYPYHDRPSSTPSF